MPEWPSDPSEYGGALIALKCFDTPSLGSDDRNRSRMYSAERVRRQLRETISSHDGWLQSLGMKVLVERLNQKNLPRAAQLLNKTNQMNMQTRRMSEQELSDWAGAEGRRLWTFRLSDRFGDSGISGIISVDIKEDAAYIVDFVMSCRVMGRQLEKVMINTVVKYVNENKRSEEIVAEYMQTERNRPCMEFWEGSGFSEREKNRYYWRADDEYHAPDYIKVEQGDEQ